MPMGLGGWTVQSQLDLCGKCHRHPSRVPPDRLDADDPVLARFQPIGLSQSLCFKRCQGRLSCVSCHEPHARASSDPAHYERLCKGCHTSSRPGPADSGVARSSLLHLRSVLFHRHRDASRVTCRGLIRASMSLSPITGSGFIVPMPAADVNPPDRDRVTGSTRVAEFATPRPKPVVDEAKAPKVPNHGPDFFCDVSGF